MGPYADSIEHALALLRRGEVIGMPTETVYGLAADARNEQAIRRVFELKGRPAQHPVIVHLGDTSQLPEWAIAIPPAALLLAEAFWPGPLTLVLNKHPNVSPLVTGGQPSVAIRVPAHPVAQRLLQAFGGGLVAPSANRYGHVSPTAAEHVRDEFGDGVPLVLEGGPCEVGIESTIVDLRGAQARVLRPGRIQPAQLSKALGSVVASGKAADSPRVSGDRTRHYAPRTPATLLPTGQLRSQLAAWQAAGLRVHTLALGALPEGACGLALNADPEAYARDLYAALRQLDRAGADRIAIEQPPDDPTWEAVRDRLKRAALAAP